jgi:hypothetical protein
LSVSTDAFGTNVSMPMCSSPCTMPDRRLKRGEWMTMNIGRMGHWGSSRLRSLPNMRLKPGCRRHRISSMARSSFREGLKVSKKLSALVKNCLGMGPTSLQSQLCVVSHQRSCYWSVKEARILPKLTSSTEPFSCNYKLHSRSIGVFTDSEEVQVLFLLA